MNPLYRETLNRLELLALAPFPINRKISIAVHRNHSFELIASVLNVFLGFSGIHADFWYSGYDDSLSFFDVPIEADIHLLWLDASRYQNEDFGPWLDTRICALRERSEGKILIASVGLSSPFSTATPDVHVFNADAVIAALGGGGVDPRLQVLSGTRLSNQACLRLARELGMRQIPGLVLPALKAVVLDLDNTLYEGVLGEDGIHGVRPYSELQTLLKELKNRGVMLALSSKNEEEDVKKLFASRSDFPLQWSDFSAWAISWDSKVEGIEQIVRNLNIGLDSILFVDDNPGERLLVSRTFPELKILDAETPAETLSALTLFPGLHRNTITQEDLLRTDDIAANKERTILRETLPLAEYFRELELSLVFALNPTDQIERITELLNKTNQFIFSFMRPSQKQIAEFIHSPGKCALTVDMSDKLSNSGIIAALLAEKRNSILDITEMAVSCRALGRGVEDAMLKLLFALAAETLGVSTGPNLYYVKGPRNKPALSWLQSLTTLTLHDKGSVLLDQMQPPSLAGVNVKLPSGVFS